MLESQDTDYAVMKFRSGWFVQVSWGQPE